GPLLGRRERRQEGALGVAVQGGQVAGVLAGWLHLRGGWRWSGVRGVGCGRRLIVPDGEPNAAVERRCGVQNLSRVSRPLSLVVPRRRHPMERGPVQGGDFFACLHSWY